MDSEDLQLIFKAIETGKCLAFLGAGACTPFYKDTAQKEEIPGLPSGEQLAKILAKECAYQNGSTYDLPEVAEYFLYRHSGDRDRLERAIQEQIQVHCVPRPIHTVLSQLNQIKIIITTNYDNLLEHELDRYNRKLRKHVYNPRDSKTGHFQGTIFFEDLDIILHKMHGSIDIPGSMVITQSDYIQYLANLNDIDRGMPEYFRKTMIPQCTLLFLGYSLMDWNFRVIWEGVLANYATRHVRKASYAIVRQPGRILTSYWAKRYIEIIDAELTEFAIELANYFKLEIPQLGLKEQPEGGAA